MGFLNTRTWTGRSITLGEIEDLCRRARSDGALGETPVNIHMAPAYSSPTDPGGEITITIRSEG